MPLDAAVRAHVINHLGEDQVPIHEALHDAINDAWNTYDRILLQLDAQHAKDLAAVDAQIPRHETIGSLREQRRDLLEAVDAAYQARRRAAHEAYEQACQDAHTRARNDGLRMWC